MREREREGKQLVQKSALFWNSLSSRLLFPLIFFSHIAIPQTSFKKQTKGSWHQTINNADTQIGVKCFGFHNVRLNGSSCTYVHTRAQIHIVHCRGFFPISNIYFLVSSQCDKKVHMHTHYALSHIQPSTHRLSHAHSFLLYVHTQAVYCLDVPRWQSVTNKSVRNTFWSRCIPPRTHLSIFPSPLHTSDKGNSVILSIHSSYPSPHCHNLPLLCDRLFSYADVLAYQTLRKWQIRSLCPFMIMSLVFLDIY